MAATLGVIVLKSSFRSQAVTAFIFAILFAIPMTSYAWETILQAENGQARVEINVSKTGGGWPTFKKTQFVVRPHLISNLSSDSELKTLLDPHRHSEIWGNFEYDPQQKGELLLIQDAYVPQELLNRPGAVVTATDMDMARTPLVSRVVQVTADRNAQGDLLSLELAIYKAKLVHPVTGVEIRSLAPEAFGAHLSVDWESPIAKARFKNCTL
jgi:hypothetical protein